MPICDHTLFPLKMVGISSRLSSTSIWIVGSNPLTTYKHWVYVSFPVLSLTLEKSPHIEQLQLGAINSPERSVEIMTNLGAVKTENVGNNLQSFLKEVIVNPPAPLLVFLHIFYFGDTVVIHGSPTDNSRGTKTPFGGCRHVTVFMSSFREKVFRLLSSVFLSFFRLHQSFPSLCSERNEWHQC